MKTIVIFGAGGHTKVIIDLLNTYNIVGIYDDVKEGYFVNIPILGKINKMTNKKKIIV